MMMSNIYLLVCNMFVISYVKKASYKTILQCDQIFVSKNCVYNYILPIKNINDGYLSLVGLLVTFMLFILFLCKIKTFYEISRFFKEKTT